jgi:hypothetical protein
MRGSFFNGAVVGLACALLGGATVALAGSGINGVFNLGVSNSVDAKTTLTGAAPGIQLQVTNTNAAGRNGLGVTSANVYPTGLFTNTGGGSAGAFVVDSGVAPFTVNSSTKVAALNADQLDGLDGGALQKRVTGTCASGSAIGTVNANGSVSCQAVGTGAGGWSLTGNAGTSPGANFLGTTDAHGLVIKTDGSEAMRITSSGDVGIGSAGPDARLEVHTDAPLGNGVHGDSGDAIGVYGTSSGNGGTGVYGAADLGGYFLGTGAHGRGIWAIGVGGTAGLFTGNVRVNGDLNVTGTKNFRIDDPLDPANKYLVHAAIESDQPLDVYSGTVTTDGSGMANVRLPEWFDRINTDLRYQLTIIGDRGWNARVSREVQNNEFTIQSDQPNVKVSWQVTARRNDPYMQAHPFQAEQAKTGPEQGRYVTPQAYGRTAADGIDTIKPQPTP